MKHLRNVLSRQIVGRAVLLICLTASAAFADAVNSYLCDSQWAVVVQAYITPQPNGTQLDVLVCASRFASDHRDKYSL